jgi:hypothetical protein
MKQPKYSPEEALNKIKLMMHYDASKTLNENKLAEQTIGRTYPSPNINNRTANISRSFSPPNINKKTATMGTMLGRMGGSLSRGTGALARGLGALLTGGAAGSAAIGGAALAGVAILALTPLAIWLATKDNSVNKVEKLFKMCSTHRAQFNKLNKNLSDEEIRAISDEIQEAINYTFLGFSGTDEDQLGDAFKQLENGTAADFCNLIDYYNKNSDSGDLFDDLDSDLDSSEDWNVVYYPVRNCVERSLKEIGQDVINDCNQNPNQEHCRQIVNPDGATSVQTIVTDSGKITFNTDNSCGTSIKNVFVVKDINTSKKYYITPNTNGVGYSLYSGDTTNIIEYCGNQQGGNKTGYVPCQPNNYVYGCTAKAIGDVQTCLGNLVVDNKFGPKTLAALKAIGYTQFTDSDIPNICNNTQTQNKPKTSDEFTVKVDPLSPQEIMK